MAGGQPIRVVLKFKSPSQFATDQIVWRCIMNNRPSPISIDRDWKNLYRAAIFERNVNVIPEKVSRAEKAVLARGRELFQQTGNSTEFEEREEVDIALYCLRAYKNALSHVEAA
jgi:hypothetical protein